MESISRVILFCILLFAVESSSIREVDQVKSPHKLSSSNVCEDRRNKLPIGVMSKSYSDMYVFNSTTLCVVNVVDVNDDNYKIFYSMYKYTSDVIELSLIEDKSIYKFDKSTINSLYCGDKISASSIYTYAQVKQMNCIKALNRFQSHILSYISYSIINNVLERSESEVNYLMENIGFTFYKPNIKNFIYTKKDDENNYEILSVIENYYYNYYYMNKIFHLKKGEVIIHDYDDGRSLSFDGKSYDCMMLLPDDKYCYCGNSLSLSNFFVYGTRYTIDKSANDVKYETEEFIHSHTMKMIEKIERDYPVSSCSNQDFEMTEVEYPKLTYNQHSEIDIGSNYYNTFLTNDYYATVTRSSYYSDYYFSRMIYRITLSDINKNQCNTKAILTITSLDEDKSIVFFSDKQRNDDFKNYDLERRYYTCKEIKKMRIEKSDICKAVNDNPSCLITIKEKSIEIPTTDFFSVTTLKRNESTTINELLNMENITSFALPSELSFIKNGNYYSNDIEVGNINNGSYYVNVNLVGQKVNHYHNYSTIGSTKYVRLPDRKIYSTSRYPYSDLSEYDMKLADSRTVMNSFINTIKEQEERIIKSPVYKTKLYGISDRIKNKYSNDFAVIMLSDGKLTVICVNYTSYPTSYKTTKYTYYYEEIDNNPNILNVIRLDDKDKNKDDGIKYETPFTIEVYSQTLNSEYFNVNINKRKNYIVNQIINSNFEKEPITSYTFINENENGISGFTSGFYYEIYYNSDSYTLNKIIEFVDYESYTLVNISGTENGLYCFSVPFDKYNIYCTNYLNDLQSDWFDVLYGISVFAKYTKMPYANITRRIDEVLESHKEKLQNKVNFDYESSDPCYGLTRRLMKSNERVNAYKATADDDISGYYEVEYSINNNYQGYFITPNTFTVNVKDYCSKFISSSYDYSNCFVQYVYNIEINTTINEIKWEDSGYDKQHSYISYTKNYNNKKESVKDFESYSRLVVNDYFSSKPTIIKRERDSITISIKGNTYSFKRETKATIDNYADITFNPTTIPDDYSFNYSYSENIYIYKANSYIFYIEYYSALLSKEISKVSFGSSVFRTKKFYMLNNGKCGITDYDAVFRISNILEVVDFNKDSNETMNYMKLKVDEVFDDIKNQYLTYPTTKPNDDYSDIYPKPEIPDDEKVAYEGSGSITPSEDGLSGGAVAGIVIGCLVGVLLICGISVCIFRRVKKEKHEKVAPVENY